MKKIKVALIIPSLGVGGAEKLVIDLCKFINRSIFETTIISFYKNSNTIYDADVKDSNCKVVYLDKSKGFDLNIVLKLRYLFKNERYDVIHTHLYVIPYVIFSLLFLKKPTIVHTVHNTAKKELRSSLRKVMKISYKYLGVIPVGISDNIVKSISDEYNISMDQIKCIYNGIDTHKYLKINSNNNKMLRLIHVGRFTRQKNHNLLIQVFYEVVKVIPNLELVLIGDGELKKDIENLVIELNISDKVIFKGITSDVNSELNKADIFILTSLWEGLPISILEAMSCSLPVITTNVGGIKDIVFNNINGIVINENYFNELTKSVIFLLDNLDLRLSMGMESRIIAEKFDIRLQVEMYQNLYLEMLNKL